VEIIVVVVVVVGIVDGGNGETTRWSRVGFECMRLAQIMWDHPYGRNHVIPPICRNQRNYLHATG
jgi:hypothetical protein